MSLSFDESYLVITTDDEHTVTISIEDIANPKIVKGE